MSHSRYSPSSRYRWSACPGSVRLIDALDLPEETSVDASEGTEAHGRAAKALTYDLHPADRSLALYVDYVRSLPGAFMVEKQLKDPENPDLYGTPDCVVYDFGGRLSIIDLKWGEGIIVSPDQNPQLEMYAVLAFAEGMDDAQEVALVIVQPRTDGEPIRPAVYPAHHVEVWKNVILDEIEACEVHDAPLHSGEHCRFCPARAHCPELARHTQLAAGMATALPDPQQLTGAQMNWLLANRQRITGYLKAVENFAMWRCQSGNPPPGWKVVEGLKNREWTDEKKAQAVLRAAGYKLNEVAPRWLLSPAQAEKIVGKDAVAPLVKRDPGAPRLVPDTDARPATNILEEFD
jgi:hypothetical protein